MLNWLLSRSAAAFWWTAASLFVVSLILLAYLYGASFLYTEPLSLTGAGPGIALAIAVVTLGAIAIASGRRAKVPVALVLVFMLLAAGILLTGGLYFRDDARRYRTEVERQLSAVADLKASQLTEWRSERMGDVSLFLANGSFSAAVERWFERPQDGEARAQVRAWLSMAQARSAYDGASLLDAHGIERLGIPQERTPVSSEVARRVSDVLRSGKVTFGDFDRNEHDGRIYLGVLLPLFDAGGGPLGVVVLRIDPEAFLYPFLRRWPIPSTTAESLLVRRDGEDVVFLNELKFQKQTALSLRFPLSSPDFPAARAVRGYEGIVEGIDYHRERVVAALRSVPDSPWFLVARIDAAEVDAPLRERLWVILALVAGLLAAAAGGMGVVWREQRVRQLRAHVEGEKERARLHDIIARSLNEVYVFDPETLRFQFVNLGACRNLGYTREEFTSLTPIDIKPEFTAETFRGMLEPVRSGERAVHVYQTTHPRKDGSEYPAEAHLQLVDSGSGPVFLCLVNDISERRRAEAQIQRLNRMYAVLSDVNQTIVRVRDRQSLFNEACRIAVETGGFKMAWVGLIDTQTNVVRPVAHAGVIDLYLDKLHIDLGDGVRGSGPTGTAVREGRHIVCNDIENDPRMAPWREDALALGCRASAAFPLRTKEGTWGTINLYASEAGFFDANELRLLDQMASDLGFAMEVAQTEGERVRLAAAIEQSPVSVVITDSSGRIEYVNDAFTRMSGYTFDEVLGGNPRILKSGKQEQALYEEMWAEITAGRSWHGELVNRRKDGSFYPHEMTIAPVQEATGVTRFVAISQDVTARQQAEERLRASEERYRVLFEESPDGVLIIDADAGAVIDANPAASRQLGYTREEFATLRLSDFEARETSEESRAHIQAVQAAGSDDFETLHRTKGGEIRSVHVWAKRILVDGHEAFHCIFEDVTERKRAEGALRAHSQELAESQRIARLGSYRHDLLAGTWTSSVILDQIFGIADPMPRRDVEAWLSVVRPDARAEMAEYFSTEVLGKRQAFDREYPIVRLNDGEKRWVHGLGRLVEDSQGRLVEMVGTIQDVTERKEAAQALQRSLHEKGALLKEVHHRVKNNLQVISSLLRLESGRIDQDAARGVLHDMQNRIQSMAVLHETLYRSDTFAEVDLGAYLRQLAGRLLRASTATPNQIALHLDLAAVGLSLDQAIPCGLIVNEFVSNSVKHAFPAGRAGELRIELHRLTDQRLRVGVSDDGVGLPPDFERKKSASLGLQLVSDLVRQLNGVLEIQAGPGARFDVTFDRVDPQRV